MMLSILRIITEYVATIRLLNARCCFFFALVFALSYDIAYAGNCAYCGKKLGSDYHLIIEDKVFCPTHFKCASCNKSIGQAMYWKIEGKYYDKACYLSELAPKCGYCEVPIESQYLIIDNKKYHNTCYKLHVAPICAICFEPIVDPYFFDNWGNRWHQTHGKDSKRCEYCERLICKASNGGEEYRDGRSICGICKEDCIMDIDAANALMDTIRSGLEAFGIVIKREKIPVQLVDRNELMRSMARSEQRILGTTYYGEQSVLYGLVKSKQIHVKILYGLPRIVAVSIIAHELTHVWQYFHGRKKNRPDFCEGSCNYASYLILRDRPEPLKDSLIARMETEPDRDYGEGYRRVAKLVNARGIPAWIEALRKKDQFPEGF
jgi:Protein DA1/LIM domain